LTVEIQLRSLETVRISLLGQRRDEVGRASPAELEADTWRIPGGMGGRTKNKLPHAVPLSSFARELFGSGFNLYPTTLSHRFRDIVRALGFEPNIRLHDLRHCCATGMASLGIPREIRERVQNQVTGRRQSMGARYDQYEYIAEKREALERWEKRLLEIIQTPPP
jgi:integrase